MRTFIKLSQSLFFAVLALFALSSRAELRPGVDFTYLPKPIASENPGKIEVVEFFWYQCSHCFETQPLLKAWREHAPKDVVVRPIHVMWSSRSDMAGHAKIYLALKNVGAMDKLHDRVFDAIWNEKLELRDTDTLAKWVASQGVPADRFMAAYNSFGISTQLAQLQKLVEDENIDGTPTFVVAGKYKVLLEQGHPMSETFSKIDQLIEMARKDNSTKKK